MHVYDQIIYANEIIKNEIESNYSNCTYVDINTIMHKDGVIDESMYEPDGLYLSAHGYRAWVDELKTQFLNKLLKPKKDSTRIVRRVIEDVLK